VITTLVAFVAVTVRVEEFPEAIEEGLAFSVVVTAAVVTVTTVEAVTELPEVPVAVAV